MSKVNLPAERICEYSSNLSSPAEIDGALFLVAQNGDILNFKEGQLQPEFHLGGQPSAIAVDSEGKNYYLADQAHQAIIQRAFDDKNEQVISELVKDYEGQPLLGPHSLTISESLNCLFFTDSGPFAETSIENAKGSVFMIDLDDLIIRPLALSCLAFPSGLALSFDEKILYNQTENFQFNNQFLRYVCETCKNRVLRFVLTNQGIYYFSVFKQFEGRFGPIDCVVSSSTNLLYVARFEFGTLSTDGIIDVLRPNGEIHQTIVIPNAPEITGLAFSSILYVTENSVTPQCLRVSVESENEQQKDKDQD